MAEFDRELRGRSWWRPDALWLACVPGEPHPVGCVAVECSPPARPWAQLHWLAVRPAWRRRGIARALVERVAGQAAGAGHRQLRAETLAAWQGAVGFYERLGFQVVR
jgi:GNAT superfamily N-acetyltransferase